MSIENTQTEKAQALTEELIVKILELIVSATETDKQDVVTKSVSERI